MDVLEKVVSNSRISGNKVQILWRGWLGFLQFYLACWEGLILHDHRAAARENHDVEVLLLLVGLLVPFSHHL